jgi:hypothetical protein
MERADFEAKKRELQQVGYRRGLLDAREERQGVCYDLGFNIGASFGACLAVAGTEFTPGTRFPSYTELVHMTNTTTGSFSEKTKTLEYLLLKEGVPQSFLKDQFHNSTCSHDRCKDSMLWMSILNELHSVDPPHNES